MKLANYGQTVKMEEAACGMGDPLSHSLFFSVRAESGFLDGNNIAFFDW